MCGVLGRLSAGPAHGRRFPGDGLPHGSASDGRPQAAAPPGCSAGAHQEGLKAPSAFSGVGVGWAGGGLGKGRPDDIKISRTKTYTQHAHNLIPPIQVLQRVPGESRQLGFLGAC